MKFILTLAVSLLSFSMFAQKSSVFWGDEFKLRRGSTDLEVVYADKTGVYLQEGHTALKSYFVIGASVRNSATLIKLDKNLQELYRNDFNKELKGKDFSQFFAIQNRFYLFATSYEKRDKSLQVYASELDKNSGALKGDWKQLATLTAEGKNDKINFKLALNADSSRLIMVSTISGREKNEYKFQEFDANLKPGSRPITVRNEFDSKTYQLVDVLYTLEKKILLIGRVYEYQEGKKKKGKFLDFANFNIRLYDEAGKFQKEINTDIDGKWLSSTTVVQEKNKDLVLAAFYSNQKKGKTVDGMLVQRINPQSGEVISTNSKDINYSMLTGNEAAESEDVDEKESREERKEREKLAKIKDEGDAFSRYLRFQKIYYTDDNGLVVIAENTRHYYHTTTYNTGSSSSPGQWQTTTYSVYECGEILACKIEGNGNFAWMRVLPKSQREIIVVGSGNGLGFIGYFDNYDGPFYAGFTAVQTNNDIQLLFNDSRSNASVTQAGQKVKLISRFGKSDCYLVKIDQATGNVNRKSFFSNSDNPTSMPRLSSAFGREIYMIGKDDRTLAKSKIAVARITIQ